MVNVTEVIHFNDELNLLEAHIVEASKYAQRVVVKEAPITWNGDPKPLHATNNWDRYSKYPKAEIMVIPAEEFEANPQNIADNRVNETATRKYGWLDVSDGADYVIECDVDEIIDPERYHELEALMAKGEYLHILTRYRNFIWFMNNYTKKHEEYRVFKTGEPELCLYPKGRPRTGTNIIGWHFSGCGENLKSKYASMSWIYGFSPEFAESQDWEEMRKNREQPARGESVQRKILSGQVDLEVDLSTYPEFIRKNPELFPWYGEVEFR